MTFFHLKIGYNNYLISKLLKTTTVHAHELYPNLITRSKVKLKENILDCLKNLEHSLELIFYFCWKKYKKPINYFLCYHLKLILIPLSYRIQLKKNRRTYIK